MTRTTITPQDMAAVYQLRMDELSREIKMAEEAIRYGREHPWQGYCGDTDSALDALDEMIRERHHWTVERDTMLAQAQDDRGYVNGLGHVQHPSVQGIVAGSLVISRDYLIERLALAAPDATDLQRERVIGAVLAYSDAAQVLKFATSLEHSISGRKGN